MSIKYSALLIVLIRAVLPCHATLGRAVASDDTGRNVLLICVDDLRPELKCFGKDYIHSPHIDQLAGRGRAFHRHYVQAPTCGASRFTLLTGRYGSASNAALFGRAKQVARTPDVIPPSLPAWFRSHGYTTVSVGKVSHHPGGRGGADWNDDQQPEMPLSWDRHLMPVGAWQHPRGAMHGLANGEIRIKAGEMDVLQSVAGPDSIYPDGLTTDEALRQLSSLSEQSDTQPFFLAVGIIRPHLPFGAPARYLKLYQDVEMPVVPHAQKPQGKTTWHGSGEFMKYNRWGRNPNTDAEFSNHVRRHYAACVTYADAQVGRLLARLDQLRLRERTIVVLWGDHGWHLGEHAIWGKHALFEESLRSPLIVDYPGIPHPGQSTQAMVETLDLFPTLCDLTGLKVPDSVDGASLRGILENPTSAGHAAVSYGKSNHTIRTDQYRLIVHKDGYVELYDHGSADRETRNVAGEHPELVVRLKEELQHRLPDSRVSR